MNSTARASTLALAMLSLLLLTSCAHTRPWRYGDLDGCIDHGRDAAFERQRSYLALRLALDTRGIGVLDSSSQAELAVQFSTSKQTIRWLIEVREDGSLHIAPPPNVAAPHRESEVLFDTLGFEYAGYRCRDEAWLRAEAQRRNVVNVAAPSGPEESPALQPEQGARAASLARAQYMERVRLALERKPIWPAASVIAGSSAAVALGAGLMVWGLAYPTTTCDGDNCSSPSHVDRVRIIAGFSVGMLGLVTAAASVPWTRRVHGERRVLREALDYMRAQRVEVAPIAQGARLSWSGRF